MFPSIQVFIAVDILLIANYFPNISQSQVMITSNVNVYLIVGLYIFLWRTIRETK